MRRLIRCLLAVGLVGPAAANDSTAELGIGGLVLTRSADIEMLSEDLYVSMEEVRVSYRFRNKTAADIDTLVAFPIPALPGGEDFYYHVLPAPEAENVVEFRVTVDGQPVTPKVEQRVHAVQLDRTDLLRQLAIPLLPGDAARAALDALPEATKQEFERLGLAYREEGFTTTPDGKAQSVMRMVAAWSVTTTFYWEQRFPAGREVTVTHRYKPVVGSTAGLNFEPKKPAANREYQQRYCMDKAFLDGAARMGAAARAKDLAEVEHRIAYVLTTGANWAGPIKRFRLVVDKGRADRLVSFCGEGVRKIGATQFEMVKSDFTPERDLHVLIVEVPRE